MMVGSMPPPIGGTTVSLTTLVSYVVNKVSVCEVVDSNPRGGSRLRAGLRTLIHVASRLRSVDIVTLHFSDPAGVTIGPLLWLVAKVFRKPVIYRAFGGSISATYQKLPRLRRWLFRQTILSSDVVLLQTKRLVHDFSDIAKKLLWFPTARVRGESSYVGRYARGVSQVLRCVYVGHVRREKGVELAIDAVSRLHGVELDLYGPMIGDVMISPYENVRYCGVLDPELVTAKMSEYDLLLFPTMYLGEGYPGTLVEASMVGLPIVATRWQSLPEMFNEDEVYFVEAGSVQAIESVLRRIQVRGAELDQRSEALRRRSIDFDANAVFRQFLDVCLSVVPPVGDSSAQDRRT